MHRGHEHTAYKAIVHEDSRRNLGAESVATKKRIAQLVKKHVSRHALSVKVDSKRA